MMEERSGARITMEAFKGKANSITSFLKFTVEIEDDHANGRVPMLNIEVWSEKTKDGREGISHSYEKKMANKKVMERDSAMPEKTKIMTLTQETIRRMKNTSTRVTPEERGDILTRQMAKMRKSGYSKEDRKKILLAGVTRYYRMRGREDRGGRRVNRHREEGEREREVKRLVVNKMWMRTWMKMKRRKIERHGGEDMKQGSGLREDSEYQTLQRRKGREEGKGKIAEVWKL